jgi:hypothetical protein
MFSTLLTFTLFYGDIESILDAGVTEFMLRIMAWLCTSTPIPRNYQQMCVDTGPNIDMAIKLIRGLKNIFERKLTLIFQDKETVLFSDRSKQQAHTVSFQLTVPSLHLFSILFSLACIRKITAVNTMSKFSRTLNLVEFISVVGDLASCVHYIDNRLDNNIAYRDVFQRTYKEKRLSFGNETSSVLRQITNEIDIECILKCYNI